MKKEKNKISLPKAKKNEIEKKIKEGKEIKEKIEKEKTNKLRVAENKVKENKLKRDNKDNIVNEIQKKSQSIQNQEERKNKILDFMKNEQYVPMKAKEIAVVFNVPKNEYEDFRKIINELETENKIEKNKKSKYKLIDSSKFLTGIFRGNQRGYGFVKIEDSDEEIYISGHNTKNALNGDKVFVEITDTDIENIHKEGKIVKILKHEKDTVVGLFQKSKNFAFVVPDDKRLGTDIFISKKNFGKARNNHKVLVKILKYPERGKNAEGKVIEVIGNVNEAGVDMLSLIKEYNLPYKFPDPVVEEAKKINSEISKEDIKNRLDLRQEEIFTIDGEDAKDLDDAVYVKKLTSGNYELGVHIADVSYYVKENSKLDKEAILRGTSIYMMDRVIPMLPRELSNGICSLNQGEDRFAISVIMEINKDGKVVSSDIKKSVINVTRRMNYKDVTTLLEYAEKIDGKENIKIEKNNESKVDFETNIENKANFEGNIENKVDTENEKNIENIVIEKYKEFIPHFVRMKELAKILLEKRKRDGSLDLDIPESKIILNEDGIAIDVKKYELTISNSIIEQFMLITNETVAEKFYWLEAPFIYRVHEAPDIEKIEELNKFLYNFGYKIKGSKDNIHPKAFAQVLESIKGKPEERVVSNLILRTLKVARYESENKGHFGIASKYYCHFTSPIRRYPDLFIHRVISKYLENNYNISDRIKEKYHIDSIDYADSSSERERVAQKVERDSIDIKKAEYMQDKIGNIYDGIVSNVTSFGVFVELENTVEGLIRFENLGDEYFIYDEEHKHLIGEHSNEIIKVGDAMTIKVIEANKESRRISFRRVQNNRKKVIL